MYTGLIGPWPRPRPSDKLVASICSRRSDVVTCCQVAVREMSGSPGPGPGSASRIDQESHRAPLITLILKTLASPVF